MKICSVNIGNPRTIVHNGKEVKTGIFKFPVDKPIFLGKEDVENDHVLDRKHHGGPDKACYLYPADHYAFWQQLYPRLELPWGVFGENLTVEGLYEDQINPGDIFRIGKAVVQASQPRQPCFKLAYRFNDHRIVSRFIEAGFPGVYVRVLDPGYVQKGDTMEALEKSKGPSIRKIFEMLYANQYDPMVLTALQNPALAGACKKDLTKRWSSFIPEIPIGD